LFVSTAISLFIINQEEHNLQTNVMIIQERYNNMYYYEVVSIAVRTEEQVPCIRVTCEISIKSFCHFVNDT